MHYYVLSLVLGIIEGLTEFLPVSSTAHLRTAVPADDAARQPNLAGVVS